VASVIVSGVSELKSALERVGSQVAGRVVQAVAAEADQVQADARSFVRVDSGDLQQSITPFVFASGMTVEVRPRSSASELDPVNFSIKATANEFSRQGKPGQPYMVPASELSRARWPGRVAQAVKDAVDG